MATRADRFIRRLSIIVSAGCVITLVGTTAVIAWPRVTHSLGIKPKPAPMPYLPGGAIDTPVEWHASTPHTLIVFARASCGACEKALPYFKQLAEFVSARAAVVVAGGGKGLRESFPRSAPGNDSRSLTDGEFARAMGLRDTSFKIAPAGLRVRSTPTLVLVDRQGRILAAWEGVGPPEKQNAIAKMIDEILK